MLDTENKINLKGMAVGNGCWGSKVGLCAFGNDMQRMQVEFLFGHAAISMPLYDKITKSCGNPRDGPGSWDNISADCQMLLAEQAKSHGDFETYNFYDTCYGGSGITSQVQHLYPKEVARKLGLDARSVGGAVNDYPCGGQKAMGVWLGQPAVTAALHVKTGTKGMAYGPRDKDDLRPLYKTLAQKYRVLIYSGNSPVVDTSCCVTILPLL
jgi:hypothetical protein